jgi:hypothetical protein
VRTLRILKAESGDGFPTVNSKHLSRRQRDRTLRLGTIKGLAGRSVFIRLGQIKGPFSSGKYFIKGKNVRLL